MNSIGGFRSLFIGFVVLILTSLMPDSLHGQVVLYMEIMTQEKPIKYYPGQQLTYKSSEYPEDWITIVIEKVLDEEKMILYDGGIINLADIIEIRRGRPWATVIGYSLQTFGVAWFGFGGLAHFTTDSFDFGVDTAVIGGTALISGWLIKKLFKYKKYKIGKKTRLKILDISWPEPTGQ